MRCLAIFLLLSLFAEIRGFGTNFWKIRTLQLERLKQRHMLLSSDTVPPVLGEILQPLDHFNTQIKTNFSQRYWVNSLHWQRPDGPVFLYISGESSLSADDAQTGTYIDFATKYGALVFAVEHRFYGESINEDGLELENLQFLSSQQALADLSRFHIYASETYNLTKNNKWISFGGSYAGSLSAWFRIKYPNLVHAAVASSAPVRAVVDFQDYNNVVARSLGTQAVGGSSECVEMVRTAFQRVDELIESQNFEQLAHDFWSCNPLQSDLDVWHFASNLADLFTGTVQYNNVNSGVFNIETVCQIMTQGSDAYQNLIALNRQFLQKNRQNCTNNLWKDFVNFFNSTTLGSSQDNRQWTYQTCSEFGYYQACDGDECIFSRYMSLPPYLVICRSVFNLSSQDVYSRINSTNAYYGSDNPQGSRIIFVNGLIDPWHALSVLRNISSTQTAIVIPETAHCADMISGPVWDPPTLKDARQSIDDQIGLWLQEDNDATPEDNVSTQSPEDNVSTQSSEDNVSTQSSEDNVSTQSPEDTSKKNESQKPSLNKLLSCFILALSLKLV